MNRKPPLAVSPRRLRPRRPPRCIPSLESPFPKTAVKPQAPLHSWHSIADETIFRHKYSITSSDLMSPETKSKDDFAANKDPIISTGPMFERGRFYDVYSAHRNERLKRKMMDISKETSVQFLEVGVELSKKSNFKKIETPRKSFPVSIASSLRSPAVRSSKGMNHDSVSRVSVMSSHGFGKRIITRSATKKIM